MRVYQLAEQGYESHHTIGIFDSIEKAQYEGDTFLQLAEEIKKLEAEEDEDYVYVEYGQLDHLVITKFDLNEVGPTEQWVLRDGKWEKEI